MFKWTARLLFLIVSLTFCYAADITDQRTNGQLNGRFWTTLTNNEKLFFVLGYCELRPPPWECPSKTEFGDIVKGIDRFYQEPENLRLPVIFAADIFKLKVAGAKTSEIEAVMEEARKFSDKPQPQK
jgi:hypothetical protein